MTARTILGALLALAIGSLFLPPRRAKESAAPATHDGSRSARVGLVFDVGGRGDKSFNDAAYDGLLRAERELGVEIRFLEPGGTEDREAALRLFAAQKLDIVIGVGFIFSSDVDAVARAHPSVRFACVDYAPGEGTMPENVLGLDFREEEGSFLVGAAAGALSKSGHVGFVGGMTIPLIRKFEAGYGAGVHATCPDCVVHVGYAGSTPEAFKDPAKGKLLATGQIAAGADVIFHASGSTGHGVFEASREGGVRAIGVDADQYDEMPGVVVTSMVKRVDVAVFEAIRSAVDGTFTGGVRRLGLAESGVDWVHDGPHGAGLPPAVVSRVEVLRGEVVAGRIKVPSE